MKILLSVFIILFTLPITSYSEIDVDKVIEDFSVIQNTGNAGREFWVSNIPIHGYSNSPDSVDFYIFSSVKTKVDFTVGSKQYSRSFEVEPNIVKLVRIDTSIVNPIKSDTSKIRDADLYENSAIHIKSEFPVIIYVFSKDHGHSDGFFAIPVSAASTAYKNTTYYSSDYGNVLYPCYTSIISHHDNSTITLTVGGGDLAEDEIEFEDGRLIKTGESTTQLMNKGDLLLLSANDNLQDISGSLIESDKPITILSGNSGASIPVHDRKEDFITNMEFPIHLYSKHFIFTPLKNRVTPGFFRAFASEDETKVYRNEQLVGTISSEGGGDYGDSYIEFDSWNSMNNTDIVSITADKPILLVYYSRYESFIRNPYFYDINAQIFQVPSVEQFVKSALISIPYHHSEGGTIFKLNHIVITFPLVENNIPDDIQLVLYDSLGLKTSIQKLIEMESVNFKEIKSEYDSKNYGSLTIELENNKMYLFTSLESKFNIYSYGSALNTSYGIPSGFSLFDRTKDDNFAPAVYYEQDCNGNINSETATVTDMPMDDENRSNLADIYMMAGENYEFDFQAPNDEFMPGMTQTVNWSLTILDNKKPASALLYAVDRAGNDTIIYIESQPSANLEMVSSENEIRNPKFKTYSFQDTIKNLSSLQSLYITRLELSGKNPKFKIVSYEPDGWTPGIPIPPKQERYINYSYTDEEIKDNQTYADSVFVGIGVNNGNEITECDFRQLSQVTVKTKYPEYSVLTGNDFGEFGNKPKITKLQDTIRNESTTRPLNISRIELKEGDQGFQISGYVPFDWDITEPIDPESEIIVDIIFNPLEFERTDNNQILTDSLGIGILEYNNDNELEEVIFNYKSEQIAVILAKDPETSIDDELELRDYILITESSIQLLPRTTTEGFYELSIYDLVGNQLMQIDTENQKSISTSTLQSGTYIITLKSEDRLLTRKLSVVR